MMESTIQYSGKRALRDSGMQEKGGDSSYSDSSSRSFKGCKSVEPFGQVFDRDLEPTKVSLFRKFLADRFGDAFYREIFFSGLAGQVMTIKVMGSYFFNYFYQVFDPDEMFKAEIDIGDPPLTEKPGEAVTGLARQGRIDRHLDVEDQVVLAAEGTVHPAGVLIDVDLALTGLVLEEVGEFYFDVGLFGLQEFLHFLEDDMKTFQVDGTVKTVQDLDKAAHMSALELMGQIDVHVEGSDRTLLLVGFVEDGDRIGDVFDPDLLDIDTPVIGLALDVFH